MNKKCWIALSGICLLFLTELCFANNLKPVNRVVAIVNDGIITQSELISRVNMIKKNLAKSKTPLPPEDIMREQVLQQMINQSLQVQLAKKSGIHVTDEEVNQAMGRIAKQNGMSLDAMYNDMTKDGDDYAAFRQEVREEVIIHQLQQRDVASQISVTPQEVKDYLHSQTNNGASGMQYHIENILITLPEAATPDQVDKAKALSEEVLVDVHKGEDFRSLAVEHSSGKAALKGGDLGWRHLAELPTVFAEKIENMKEGDVAGPIRTPNGFHLIKLAGIRKDASAPSKDQASREREIANLIFRRKLNEHLQTWLTQLRAGAYVEIIHTQKPDA